MKYKIETIMSERYTHGICEDLGIDPEKLPDEVIRMVRYDFNDSKEVQEVMPHLLDMVTKGNIASIKIEGDEDQ